MPAVRRSSSAAARLRAGLPEQARTNRGAVRSRRRSRRDGAHPRATTHRARRTVIRRRQPDRCERHHRHRTRGQGAAGRLHPAGRLPNHSRGRAGALRQGRLRCGARLRAGDRDRDFAAVNRRASVVAGEVGRRFDQARQVPSRTTDVWCRVGRHAAYGRRAVQAQRRHRHAVRAVQRRRPGDRRYDRRTNLADFFESSDRLAAGARRQVARDRDYEPATRRHCARISDRGRIGIAGL